MKKDYSVYVILSATELKMGKIIRFLQDISIIMYQSL